jgi:hypothetical protein
LRLPPGTTNTSWAGGKNKNSSDEEDTAVSLGLSSVVDIRKTVGVTVTDQNHEDLEIGREQNIGKFEHV